VTVTEPPPTSYPAPTGVSVVSVTDKSVSLKWNRYTAFVADDYNIHVRNASGTPLFVHQLDPDPKDGLPAPETGTVPGLQPGTIYRFVLTAENGR
jgi:Fibronectin type III domain